MDTELLRTTASEVETTEEGMASPTMVAIPMAVVATAFPTVEETVSPTVEETVSPTVEETVSLTEEETVSSQVDMVDKLIIIMVTELNGPTPL